MPCCLLIALLVLSPRIILVLMFFFSNYLDRAFHHQWLMPLLGFIFLPLTTLVYAWEVNNHMPLAGINLVFIVIAVVIDVGAHGGGVSRRWRDS